MVVFSLIIVSNVQAFQPEYYCEDEDTLNIEITLNQTGNLSVFVQPVDCDYGCDNSTWTNFMDAGCKESPIVILLLGIFLVVGFIILMRVLL